VVGTARKVLVNTATTGFWKMITVRRPARPRPWRVSEVGSSTILLIEPVDPVAEPCVREGALFAAGNGDGFLEETANGYSQNLGEAAESLHGRKVGPAFDAGDVWPGDAGPLGEILLQKAESEAEFADALPDGVCLEYVYYRCTGWKNGGSVCADTYIREEDLVEQLGLALKELKLDPQTFADLQFALKKSYAAEKEFAGKRTGVLRAEESRLKNRIDQAYNDKLDGLITAEHYAEKVALWREQLAKARAELAGLEVAHDLYLNEASRILDLAQRAFDLYMAQTDNFERPVRADPAGLNRALALSAQCSGEYACLDDLRTAVRDSIRKPAVADSNSR